jgi:hypothetical protein
MSPGISKISLEFDSIPYVYCPDAIYGVALEINHAF